VSVAGVTREDPIATLRSGREIELLRQRVAEWLEGVDIELRKPLASALDGPTTGLRPLTLFAAHRAVRESAISPQTVNLAFTVELIHNMSLIVDDILDESQPRRDVANVKSGFGKLPALMASGYLVADAFEAVAGDAFACRHVAELLRRLAATECVQWRLRRAPLGTEDWRRIAGEATGSMFEICAVLGARSERLRRYGHVLGVLYHGCDDVADQRATQVLLGGGDEDIRKGVLTLPASIAIRDRRVRDLFLADDDDEARLASLAVAFRAQLEDAENVLDAIAQEAREEARISADDPTPLLALVDEVRCLSRR
jgi:geranylgeranyl pyrophosphate synthase